MCDAGSGGSWRLRNLRFREWGMLVVWVFSDGEFEAYGSRL